jgi:DNA-binding beta-propeller fold protein YncE
MSISRIVAPLLLSLPLLSTALVAYAQHGYLLVAQKDDHSLGIVDPVAGSVIASVPTGGITGHEVTASPDGRLAYVPIYGSGGVGGHGTNGQNMVVIDIAAQKVVGNLDFGHGVRPHLPAIGPKDGMLYVSTELDRSISIIDPKTLTIVGAVPTGQIESHMYVLTHDGLRGYTANVGPGTVSVLDIPNRKTITIIPISNNTQRISISPDDRWVFTSDQKQPRLAVIDTKVNQVTKWIPLDGYGYGSAVTPNGRWLLIAIPSTNSVDVIDLKTMAPAPAVALPGKTPQEVLIRPDGKTAYVSCVGSDQVAEIDLGSMKVSRMIATGKGSDGLAWAAGK